MGAKCGLSIQSSRPPSYSILQRERPNLSFPCVYYCGYQAATAHAKSFEEPDLGSLDHGCLGPRRLNDMHHMVPIDETSTVI